MGRWLNNFSLTGVTWYLSGLVVGIFLVYLLHWIDLRQYGLLNALQAGPIASFIVFALVMQFAGYVLHVAYHKIPWLWPIHAIHHSDVDVDASTSFRHHPLEPLIFLPVLAPIFLLTGVSLEVAVTYELLEAGVVVFSHSNIRLPETVDRHLRKLMVTPGFHRLHHCAERRFTDSNYGGIVPWFDYLFGTATSRPAAEHQRMQLGLEYLRKRRDGRLDQMLIAPFIWRRATARKKK